MILNNNNLQLDNSYVTYGIVIAKVVNNLTKTKHKLQVTKDNYQLYYTFYEDTIEVPLQLGKGVYKFEIYKNTSGNKYIPCGFISINAIHMDPDAYLLRSNQYVRCNDVDTILADIPALDNDEEQLAAIRKYIKDNYVYDYIKQLLPKKEPLPNIPDCISKKKGTCQDFASLAVALCRRFRIKATLVIGKCNGSGVLHGAHAWVKVYIGDDEILYDPTADVLRRKNAKWYQPERWY